MSKKRSRTYVSIDYLQIQKNARILKSLISSHCLFMSVIKGNAYGHGIEETAKSLDSLTDWFAVATFEEALSVRKVSQKPILVLGYVDDSDLLLASYSKITLAGLSEEYIKHIENYCHNTDLKIDVHIEIDTGFNRTGITCRENTIETVTQKLLPLYQLKNVKITGLYTHYVFAGSVVEEEKNYTEKQFSIFQKLKDSLASKGIDTGICHTCNSKATVYDKDKHLDMVRVGAYLFGLASPKDRELLGIKGAIHWAAKIIHVKDIPAGEGVGYGHQFIAEKKTRVAVVSAGFADGVRRCISLSDLSYVVYKGNKLKIIGSICMDMMMVDVTPYPDLTVGEFVTLVGYDNGVYADSYLLGKIIHGTAGEIPVGITDRVLRIR